jgi:hypothetical protein
MRSSEKVEGCSWGVGVERADASPIAEEMNKVADTAGKILPTPKSLSCKRCWSWELVTVGFNAAVRPKCTRAA